MNTTNRPATPLPLRVRRSINEYLLTDCDDKTVAHLLFGSELLREKREQDAAYIVHACNAYPKLMDALWRAIAMLEFNGIKTDQYKAIGELRAIYAKCEEGKP